MRNHSAPKQRQKRHRCSEQSRRKTVTQSHGTNATSVAMSAGPPAQDWAPAAFCVSAAGVTNNRLRTLLRAKPSKGGDAELRDYRDSSRHVRRAASATTLDAGGFFFGGSVMTFTHKLSARLALLRNVALVAILAMMSCKIESRVALSDQAAKIVISPSQVVVSANQTADLYAVALDAAGDTASTGIMWSTTGGSVTETATGGRHRGRYQPPAAPGQYQVKARANPGSAADSATVTVSNVSVASLTLPPPTAGNLVGPGQQFTAAPLDYAANPPPHPPLT